MSTLGSGTFSNVSGGTSTNAELHHGIVAEWEPVSRGIYELGGNGHDHGCHADGECGSSTFSTVTLQNTNSNLLHWYRGAPRASVALSSQLFWCQQSEFNPCSPPRSLATHYLVNTASQLCWDFQNGSMLPGLFSSNIPVLRFRLSIFQLSPTSSGNLPGYFILWAVHRCRGRQHCPGSPP